MEDAMIKSCIFLNFYSRSIFISKKFIIYGGKLKNTANIFDENSSIQDVKIYTLL